MRFFAVVIAFFALGLNFVSAQKFGYIDSDFILGKMPDYKKAQDEIDQLSVGWQKEVEEMQKAGMSGVVFYNEEWIILSASLVLGLLCSFIPAVQAYRTDISRVLAGR